jgi:hypothetical protein
MVFALKMLGATSTDFLPSALTQRQSRSSNLVAKAKIGASIVAWSSFSA